MESSEIERYKLEMSLRREGYNLNQRNHPSKYRLLWEFQEQCKTYKEQGKITEEDLERIIWASGGKITKI